MKRALAERAKQSVVQAVSRETPSSSSSEHHQQQHQQLQSSIINTNDPSPKDALSSSSDLHDHHPSQPPKKLAKVISSSGVVVLEAAPSSSASAVTSASASLSHRAGQKRPRGGDSSTESGDPSSSAFYLQHQNRALAVELQSLKHSVRTLERERDQRRQECYTASQALHSLQATWTQLETVLTTPQTPSFGYGHFGGGGGAGDTSATSATSATVNIVVPSTGTGDAIEWTRSLSQALAALGGLRAAEGDDDWSSQCAANLAARAAVLQERLWPVLTEQQQQQHQALSSSSNAHNKNEEISELPSSSSLLPSSSSSSSLNQVVVAEHEKVIQEKLAEIRLRQSHVEELKAARDAAVSSERKVRRNVYRLAAGMINTDQLVAAIQDDKEVDVELQQQIAKQKLIKQEEEAIPAISSSSGGGGGIGSSSGGGGGDGGVDGMTSNPALVSSARAEALQARISDLEHSVRNRDDSIEELTKQLGEKESRITYLTTTQRSENDLEKIQGWESLSKKVEVLQSSRHAVVEKLAQTRDNWAQAQGDRDTAIQAMEEQHGKFNKRWAELVRNIVPGASGENGDNIDETDTLLDAQSEAQAKEIIELQHKLSQALENVRQSESIRLALKDALAMNESIQGKLDDLKSKYNALRNSSSAPSRQGAASSSDAHGLPQQQPAATPSTSSSTSRENAGAKEAMPSTNSSSTSGGSNATTDKLEKLHREHRRMRKEITAVVASKEAAKAKLEKVEKERDSLIESNTRLLKQMTEKDEMNAKSLSTILHLKSMTEELKKERDNLEQQAKSASQLALTARLASNAKERVSEEILKEKKALELQVDELEAKLAASKSSLEQITVEFAAASGKTTILNADLSNALNRCQELVVETEKKCAEVRVLADAVSKAEREAREAAMQLQKLMKRSGGDESASTSTGTFTVDQLNTQISVLKNRLACPVCHYRDKECIIMRCRHMHCKQCVEERISNRSRKCPTCNNKFSEKDVEDVWLN